MLIRKAGSADIKSVFDLNSEFYKAFIDNDKEKGFLRNQFSESQIQEMISNGDVVIAEDFGQVVGYYLIDRVSKSTVLIRRAEVVESLMIRHEIPEGKYALLTQAAVKREFMGKGVAKCMLDMLKSQVGDDVDYLVGYIDNDNHNGMTAHLRSGWRIFTEYPGGYLALIPTKHR